MDQLGNSNPKMQMLAQLMNQQNQQQDQAGNDKLRGQLKKMIQLNQELKKKLTHLKKQRRQLLEYFDFFLNVNSVFAGAVGACECWGEDPECEKCQGRGEPGFFPVDQEAFDYYIKPCLPAPQKETSA